MLHIMYKKYKPVLQKSVNICCRVVSTNKQHVSKSVVKVSQEM